VPQRSELGATSIIRGTQPLRRQKEGKKDLATVILNPKDCNIVKSYLCPNLEHYPGGEKEDLLPVPLFAAMAEFTGERRRGGIPLGLASWRLLVGRTSTVPHLQERGRGGKEGRRKEKIGI